MKVTKLQLCQLAAHGAKLVISARRESELGKVRAGCLGKNVTRKCPLVYDISYKLSLVM